MQYRPDIVVADQRGEAVAIIEVKALGDTGVRTATRYLRNLLAHGLVPTARYVLLVTANTGYLWSTPAEVLQEAAPSFNFPMDGIIRHYLPSNSEPVSVRDIVLESIVKQWISDLTDGVAPDALAPGSLRGSGFLNAVRGGLVSVQTPV